MWRAGPKHRKITPVSSEVDVLELTHVKEVEALNWDSWVGQSHKEEGRKGQEEKWAKSEKWVKNSCVPDIDACQNGKGRQEERKKVWAEGACIRSCNPVFMQQLPCARFNDSYKIYTLEWRERPSLMEILHRETNREGWPVTHLKQVRGLRI